jgi:hypothetical protein
MKIKELILKIDGFNKKIPVCILYGKTYIQVENVKYNDTDTYLDKDGESQTGFIEIT